MEESHASFYFSAGLNRGEEEGKEEKKGEGEEKDRQTRGKGVGGGGGVEEEEEALLRLRYDERLALPCLAALPALLREQPALPLFPPCLFKKERRGKRKSNGLAFCVHKHVARKQK